VTPGQIRSILTTGRVNHWHWFSAKCLHALKASQWFTSRPSAAYLNLDKLQQSIVYWRPSDFLLRTSTYLCFLYQNFFCFIYC